MNAILTYLGRRIPERSTWIGLGLLAGALVLFWVYRQEIFSAVTLTAGTALAAIPGRIFQRVLPMSAAIKAPELITEPEKETITMSFLANLETAALEGMKTVIAALPEPDATLAKALLSVAEDHSAGNIMTQLVNVAGVAGALKDQIVAAQAAAVPVSPPVAPEVAAEPTEVVA